MIVWLQFLACTVIILFAGTKLSTYGDVIAEKTGLGRTWIGVVLMALVTSLPELITGVSSVLVFDLPDIAVGDVLGSCMFNMLILVFLDFRSGTTPLSSQAHQGQVLAAACGILLLGLVNIALAASARMPVIGWVGAYSVVFFLAYIGVIRLVLLYEQRRAAATRLAAEKQYEHITKGKAYSLYTVNALIVIAAATWLPYLGEEIAVLTGLGRSFVGSIIIALATSLPELVVSFAALRLGAVDLAVGNLFGSSVFNIAILAVDDALYFKGPLLSHISGNHHVTISAAMIMTAIAIAGLTYRAEHKPFRFAWDSIAIVTVYVLATLILYLLG
jgi:cation:H+ antiporter